MTTPAEDVARIVLRPITDLLLDVVATDGDRHRLVQVRSNTERWQDAALWVATYVARLRCGNSPLLFNAWLTRLQGGAQHPAELHDVLVAHVASDSIGTPAAPAPTAHLEGLVAEHIWHALTTEVGGALGKPIRVEEPSWSVTDAGGDGLAIFRVGDTFAFRLWESKSHTAAHPVGDTVNRACRQLSANAMRYLARFSKVGQELADAQLARFYGRLAELWRNADPASGAGVSVCTSPAADLDGSFEALGEYWEFTERLQREGLLAIIEDFPHFAIRVREHLWNGL
jgi:hypothetical protein